jgi:hypothetical protein
MARKSSTKRKSDQSKATLTDEVIRKAQEIFSEEAKNTFICAKISTNKYKVGNFIVTEQQGVWNVVENSQKLDFNIRANAVAYCALMYMGKRAAARQLATLDSKAGQLTIDEDLYRQKLSDAINKRDTWKVDLYNARYTNVKAHLLTTKIELQKTLNTAKYINSWD